MGWGGKRDRVEKEGIKGERMMDMERREGWEKVRGKNGGKRGNGDGEGEDKGES